MRSGAIDFQKGSPRTRGSASEFVGEIPVAPRVAVTARRQVVAGLALTTPRHRVRDHALNLGLVIDREFLVTRAEVHDPTRPAAIAAAAAEHLAACKRADEDELVRRWDVEVLAVHLLMRDDDRLRHAGSDGMPGVDGPDHLPLAAGVRTPPQRTSGPNQPLEDLRQIASGRAQ